MSETSGIAAGRLSQEDYARNFDDLHAPLERYEAKVAADRCFLAVVAVLRRIDGGFCGSNHSAPVASNRTAISSMCRSTRSHRSA